MGQNAMGIVYGVKINGKIYDSLREIPGDDDSEWHPWLDGFETGSESEVLGISLMTSCYAEEGEKEFDKAVALTDLQAFLKVPIASARKKWLKLISKLDQIGVRLPEPELILVQVERA